MKLFTIYVDKWAGRSVRTVKHSVRASDLGEACSKAIESRRVCLNVLGELAITN